MELTHHMRSNLKRLRLPGVAETLDVRVREARENKLGYLEFLSLLVQDEIVNRDANNLQKRLKAAGFPYEKTFEGFDFSFNEESFPSATVRDLATCNFILKKQNLLICGPPGIGKSHIAQAIGHETCRRGKDVLFRKTSQFLSEILAPKNPARGERFLKKALSVSLLILDDFALRTYDQSQAEVLYTVADERIGRATTIVTANRPPQDWYGVFPDSVIGGAILDRLVSGAIKIITTKGRSYRKELGSSPIFPVDDSLKEG
jgi:DNA replication protein DnaC